MQASRNQLANALNPYQGSTTKALCICSAGLLRSPSIAKFLTEKGYNTRAVGMSQEYALIPLNPALLIWADEIHIVKEQHENLGNACAQLNDQGIEVTDKVFVYDIPDEHGTFEPELMARIEEEWLSFDEE